jgi:hypothetical protein
VLLAVVEAVVLGVLIRTLDVMLTVHQEAVAVDITV